MVFQLVPGSFGVVSRFFFRTSCAIAGECIYSGRLKWSCVQFLACLGGGGVVPRLFLCFLSCFRTSCATSGYGLYIFMPACTPVCGVSFWSCGFLLRFVCIDSRPICSWGLPPTLLAFISIVLCYFGCIGSSVALISEFLFTAQRVHFCFFL